MNPHDTDPALEFIRDLRAGPRPGVSGLSARIEKILTQEGLQPALNVLLRSEVALGLRRPTLGIYDHAFHLIGGAQKYGLTLAASLRGLFDVTIIANKDICLEEFRDWYGLDLSGFAVKIIKVPFYEERQASFLDPALVSTKDENPFHIVSRESGHYDVFVNNSMNEMVYPLSNISVLICHFPERLPQSYFYCDRYTQVVYNSRYTAEWIERMWKLRPHEHIYPPVDLEKGGAARPKEKLILSVARFEPEGTKRQREMIEAFLTVKRLYPEVVRGWKFVLAGGSEPKNRYLDILRGLTGDLPGRDIELRVNIPASELRDLYREASIFWHICGIVHEHPSEVEHFGMTTVEAMENRAVPVVYDGGGLREIVNHGVDGFRVRTKGELLEQTIRLIRDPGLVERLGEAARRRAQNFSRARFEERVRDFFGRILSGYRGL
jgi:glycosyltransferase involved in cell wall biosynthesis